MAANSWVTDSGSSGYRTTVAISKKVLQPSQPMMKIRQFVSVEPAFGKGKGESVQIYRAGNSSVEYDTASINELDRIPVTTTVATPKLITVNEYGRAWNYTEKLETLSEVDIKNDIILKSLRNHMAKTIEYQIGQAFRTSDVMYIPTSATAGTWDVDGTASTQALANISTFHIKEIVDGMKMGKFGTNTARPVPFYADNYYMCVASTKFLRGLHDDPDFESISDYANAEGFYRGEIGRMPFYNVRFVESNFAGLLTNGVGSGSVLGEAFIFGEDPIREIVAIPEEVREKVGEDYGRDMGVAWYAILGWGRTWDYSTDGEERIVRVTSS